MFILKLYNGEKTSYTVTKSYDKISDYLSYLCESDMYFKKENDYNYIFYDNETNEMKMILEICLGNEL